MKKKKDIRGLVRRHPWLWSFLGLLVLGLIGVRVWLPFFVLQKVNAALETANPAMTGHVVDVDLAIYRGAYRLDNLTLELVRPGVPETRQLIAKVRGIDASVAWRDLLRGRVRVDVDLEQPSLMLERAVDFGKLFAAKKEQREGALRTSKALVPFLISRLRIVDGEISSGLFKSPEIKPLVEGMEGIVSDLYDTQEVVGSESLFHASGRIVGGGEMRVVGSFGKPSASEPVQWNAGIQAGRFPLTRLNAILLDVVPMTFTKGSFSAEANVESRGDDMKGRLRAAFKDVDVISNVEHWKGPRQGAIELISAFAFILTKNPDLASNGVVVDFERRGGKLKIDYGEAFRSAIDHWLGRAVIKPTAEDQVRAPASVSQ